MDYGSRKFGSQSSWWWIVGTDQTSDSFGQSVTLSQSFTLRVVTLGWDLKSGDVFDDGSDRRFGNRMSSSRKPQGLCCPSRPVHRSCQRDIAVFEGTPVGRRSPRSTIRVNGMDRSREKSAETERQKESEQVKEEVNETSRRRRECSHGGVGSAGGGINGRRL